ncbi:MAG: radical SAM protein, partial [Candidatus Omnitrophica bacterium]|nr:radical SAM protein [Candidatus Omnitrophota bacterium]
MTNYPAYIKTSESGKLKKVAEALFDSLAACAICPRSCLVNRLENKTGSCKTGKLAKVYSFMAHFGEEPAISGKRGSG